MTKITKITIRVPGTGKFDLFFKNPPTCAQVQATFESDYAHIFDKGDPDWVNAAKRAGNGVFHSDEVTLYD